MNMKRVTLLFLFLFSPMALSHEGPPFPILVDHPFSTYKLSVWADPDTGNGTFLFYPEDINEKSSELNFIFEVRATSKNEILKAHAIKGITENGKFTYTASLPFTHEAIWNVEISVLDKQNGNSLTTVTLPVEVTPPGPSPSESLVYALPFVIVIGIWLKVVLKKRQKRMARS